MALTPIHRGLGLEPSELTGEIVKQAIAARLQEADDLDWKKSVHDKKNPTWRDELAKDVAAMCNSGGGWIVFGVEETDGRAESLSPIDWNEGEEQRIRQVAYAHIGPPITGLEFHPIPLNDDGDQVVAMRIPASLEAPHLARSGDDKFRAPFRNGSHTVFMSEREIERAYSTRFTQRRAWDDELVRLTDEAATHPGVLKAVLVALPREYLPENRTAITDDFGRSLLTRATQARPLGLRGYWTVIPPHHSVRAGLRRLKFSATANLSINSEISLFYDGTVSLTCNLGILNPDLLDEPTHTMAVYIEVVVSDFFTLLSELKDALGVEATYGIRFDLDWDHSQPVSIRSSSWEIGTPKDAEESELIHVFTPLTTALAGGATPEEGQTIAARLALDAINQGGVRYLKLLSPDDQTPL